MSKVSAIIVNFNTKDLLEKCVDTLVPITLIKEVIVVDNSSSDGSFEMAKKYIDPAAPSYSEKVRLIKSENKGLAAGYNTGLRSATGTYILYIGSDAYPTQQALTECVGYLEDHSDVGALTPRLVLRDGLPDMDAHRGLPTPWTALTHFSYLDRVFPKSPLFSRYFLGFKDLATVHEIELCIAHFMLVPRQIHDKIGIWDENYFLFGEDVDMCYRIKQAGYKIVYLGTTEVLHYKGATIGRKTSQDLNTAGAKTTTVKKVLATGRTQSMKYFYQKHFKNVYPKFLTSGVLVAITMLEKIRTFYTNRKKA